MSRTWSIVLFILVLGTPAVADDGVAFFRDEVKPILTEHCFKCHGGSNARGEIKIRGGLQMISRKGLMIGGEHGPAIDDQQASNSLLLRALSYTDEDLEMPPRGKLPDAQIDTIRRWLEIGAPWTPGDADLLVEADDPRTGITEVNDKTRAHWSYRPMQWDDEPADRLQHLYDVLDDDIRVTSEAFMAMTIGCARCHDHKGDPVPQADYYRFLSFFHNIKPIGKGNANTAVLNAPDIKAEIDRKLADLRAEEEALREQVSDIEQQAVAIARDTNPDLASQLAGAGAAGRWLITDARTKPWSWHHTTTQPAPEWSDVSLRAGQQGWKEVGRRVPPASAMPRPA